MTSHNDALDFAPDMLRVQRQAPSPLPRVVMYVLLALLCVMIVWAFVGQLDVVATAQGKIVPQSFLKIVQPAEQGIVREILVRDGDAVAMGQTLVRMDAFGPSSRSGSASPASRPTRSSSAVSASLLK